MASHTCRGRNERGDRRSETSISKTNLIPGRRSSAANGCPASLRVFPRQITKSHYSQRGDPATLLIVAGEDWPTAIRILGTHEKLLSTFDIAYRRRAEDERGVARRLNCWLRRRCKSSPASTRELS